MAHYKKPNNKRKLEQVSNLMNMLYMEVEEENEDREKGRLRNIKPKDITNLKMDIANELDAILKGEI